VLADHDGSPGNLSWYETVGGHTMAKELNAHRKLSREHVILQYYDRSRAECEIPFPIATTRALTRCVIFHNFDRHSLTYLRHTVAKKKNAHRELSREDVILQYYDRHSLTYLRHAVAKKKNAHRMLSWEDVILQYHDKECSHVFETPAGQEEERAP